MMMMMMIFLLYVNRMATGLGKGELDLVSDSACEGELNFIAYSSSKVSDCNFEIHLQWESGFSRMYSNCCCSCSIEAEIINIGQSSHKMYSNNRLNFQMSTTILNAHTKKVWKSIISYAPCIYIYIYIKGARGVMVIVVGNGHGEPSSKTKHVHIFTNTHTHTHTHIYITYTYIYNIHRQICFVLSELISVARHISFP